MDHHEMSEEDDATGDKQQDNRIKGHLKEQKKMNSNNFK